MKKLFYVSLLSFSLVFGSDYSASFECACQPFVHFENKGETPVEFDLKATIARMLNPKEQQRFMTDDGFSYVFNGKNYQRGTLVNPHDQEARFDLTGPDGARILQKRHITLAPGETIDITLNFISYFVGLENLSGMSNHLAWSIGERGLEVFLGVNNQRSLPSFPSAYETMVHYAKGQLRNFTAAGYFASDVDGAVQHIKTQKIPVPSFLINFPQGTFHTEARVLFADFASLIPEERRLKSQQTVQKFVQFLIKEFCRPHAFKFIALYNPNNQEIEKFKGSALNSCPFIILSESPVENRAENMVQIPYSVLTTLNIINGISGVDQTLAKSYLKTLLATLSAAHKEDHSTTVQAFAAGVKLQNMPQMLAINELLHGTTKAEYEANRAHLMHASQQQTLLPANQESKYLIPPITHRIWLTDRDQPKEVPADKLEHYLASLQHFKDPASRHMFWCFNPDDIPETVKILRTFKPPVEIHTIDEVAENFKCAPLINKLLRDKLFGFASNIIRKEVLFQLGGVYNDIALRQKCDIAPVLKQMRHIFYLNEGGCVDVCFMAFEKESEFLRRDLLLIGSLSELAKKIKFSINLLYPQNWTTSSALITTGTSKQWEGVYYMRQNREFTYHGMRLWNSTPQYKILEQRPNYFFEEDKIKKLFCLGKLNFSAVLTETEADFSTDCESSRQQAVLGELQDTSANKYADVFTHKQCSRIQCTNFGDEKVSFKVITRNNNGDIENIICNLESGEMQTLESKDSYFFIGLQKIRSNTYCSWQFVDNNIALSVTTGKPRIQNVKKRFKLCTKYDLDLINPTTFNEKITWMMLNYKPYMTLLADKLLVREYLEKKGCGHILVPLLAKGDCVEDIDWGKLPKQFVVKTNHDSRTVKVIQDKDAINYEELRREVNSNLLKTYGINSHEPHYYGITPKVLVEKMIGLYGEDLIDHKCFCFNGKVKYIQVINLVLGNRTDNFFDIEWNNLGRISSYIENPNTPLKPVNLDEMIQISEKLSETFAFVRVDFHSVGDDYFFSELTFTPVAGAVQFINRLYDEKFGESLNFIEY
jgi:hypothetical protein